MIPKGIAIAAAISKPVITRESVAKVSMSSSLVPMNPKNEFNTSDGEGKIYSGIILNDVNKDQAIRIKTGIISAVK